MKYGIICAMEEEIRLLLSDMTDCTVTEIAHRAFTHGTLYGKEVVLVQSRIGKVASASTATTLIDRFAPDCVIFCGTAGGVAPSLHVGDVVIGDKLVQHDFDCGVPEEIFEIPLLGIKYFKTDASLNQALVNAVENYINDEMRNDIPDRYLKEFGIQSPAVHTGTIASGDQFICDNEKNQWLYTHVDDLACVEMEGAAVAQVCYEFDVPCAVVRVISDSANDDSNVDFARFVEEAACHFTRGIMKAFLTAQK